jgi:Ca2+-binding RTX toxin-like protein
LATRFDTVQLSEILAGFTSTLDVGATADLIGGLFDSQDLPGLRAILSMLRSTVTTGAGNDVVSGVVLANFRTGDGDDRLFAGTFDASPFVEALASAGFSVPATRAALAASGAVLEGGNGDDIYYFVGNELGHLTINEYAAPAVDESQDVLDFSGFAGGALSVDIASTVEQTVTQGSLWLKIADGLAFENVIGTRQGDRILLNDRENFVLGSDPLEDRAIVPDLRETQTQWVLLDFDSETELGEHNYTLAEREAIRSRLDAAYRGPDPNSPWFDFRFVLNLPDGVTQYTTVFFNQTPDGEAAGGFSDEIDFRNISRSSRVILDVNGLLGGPGQPSATSENFVSLSTTIAAHEVGHAVGARHGHSFGPIGFGAHIPPGRAAYTPDYAGLSGAIETTFHIMASPASVGSSLAQAASGPFFSERTAIVLAFSEQGVVLQEDAEATQSAGGQTLGELPGLMVPNTVQYGLNAAKDLSVAATAVVGRLDAVDPTTGMAENDLYSFAGRAGDLISIDVMSSSLTRYAKDSIDAVVRVLDSTGSVLPYFDSPFGAFNDDQFEPGDAAILDLTLPADGTYFIEVDSFHFNMPEFSGEAGYRPPDFDVDAFCAVNPEADACNDTDTGNYELFIYRFDAGHATDGGDWLEGRGGNDVLFGLSDNDTFIVGEGIDVVDGGVGVDTISESADVNFVLTNTELTGAGVTLFSGVEHAILEGGASANTLDVSAFSGDTTLIGAAGDDVMIGGFGDDTFVFDQRSLSDTDTVIGGDGRDRLDFGGRAVAIDLNLSQFGSPQDLGGGQTLLIQNEDIEEVIGTLAGDQIIGNTLDNLLIGDPGESLSEGGDDKLVGGSGYDVLLGHAGADNLVGGPDDDVLVGGTGADRIVGSAGHDVLFSDELIGTYYDNGALAPYGNFESARWWNNFELFRALSQGWSAGGGFFNPIIEQEEDGDFDDLTGSAGRDWFFIGLGDITDFSDSGGDRLSSP